MFNINNLYYSNGSQMKFCKVFKKNHNKMQFNLFIVMGYQDYYYCSTQLLKLRNLIRFSDVSLAELKVGINSTVSFLIYYLYLWLFWDSFTLNESTY